MVQMLEDASSRSESDSSSYLSSGSLNNVIIGRWKVARSLAGGSKVTYRAPVLGSLSSSFMVKPHAVVKVPNARHSGPKRIQRHAWHFTTPRASSSRLTVLISFRTTTSHVGLSPQVVVATPVSQSNCTLPYRWVCSRRRCSPDRRLHEYRSWSLGLHKDAKIPESVSGISPPIPTPLDGRATTIRGHDSWRDALGAETARTHLSPLCHSPTSHQRLPYLSFSLLRPRPTLFGRFARSISSSGDGPVLCTTYHAQSEARNVTLILNTISALTYAQTGQR
jgi:hypothetical protein